MFYLFSGYQREVVHVVSTVEVASWRDRLPREVVVDEKKL